MKRAGSTKYRRITKYREWNGYQAGEILNQVKKFQYPKPG
jgi:hypothetical protein